MQRHISSECSSRGRFLDQGCFNEDDKENSFPDINSKEAMET